MFTLNAVLVITLQVPVGSVLARFLTRVLLLGANLGMAAAVMIFALGREVGLAGLVVAMVVFTLAELVWSPLYDTEVNARRGAVSSAAAYGVAGVAWGGAEAFAAWLGSLLVVGSAGAAPYWAGALLAAGSGVALAWRERARREMVPA